MRGRIDLQAAAVIVVLLLGVFFRFGDLDSRLFWHDEVFTKFFAAGRSVVDWQEVAYTGDVFTAGQVQALQRHDPSASVLDTVVALARDEPQHPPLYYVLARLQVSLFGDSIGTLRALSGLLGLLVLPAAFWLCRELFGRQRRIGLAAVALLAVSPYFVLFATEARGYALWGVCTLVSTAALLRALRKSEEDPTAPHWGAWALVSLSLVASLYTAFASVWVIAGQVLYVIVRDRLRFRPQSLRAAGAYAVGALCFLPWALVLRTHWDAFAASTAWSKQIVIPRPELLWHLALNASRPFVDVGVDVTGPERILVGALALLGLVGLGALVRHGPPRGLAVLFVAVVPLALLLGPDLVLGGIRSMSGRYLGPTWAMLLIALAWFCTHEGPRARLRLALLGVLLGMAIVSGFQQRGRETSWHMPISEAVPEAARIIEAAPSPLVVGNREQHFPGNLLVLALRLEPSTRLQFSPLDLDYALPAHDGAVFLFCPNGPLRDRLERQGVRLELVLDHLHLTLWRVR